MNSIYLDYSSTTPVDKAVAGAMQVAWSEDYGNPSSVHRFGQKAKVRMNQAREKMASLLGCDGSELYFTSGGTEADNLALKGVAYASQKKGRHIITSQTEHHAVLHSAEYLAQSGFDVTFLPVDELGKVDPQQFKAALRPDTTLVSIMMVNNETGTIQPIREMAEICRSAGVLFHTDAVQAVGKIPINISDLGVDLLSFSGHKIYGPKGIGGLFIRKGVRIAPLFHGGSHEKRKRAGTENIAAIIGMATALEMVTSRMDEENSRLAQLSDWFINEIQAKIKDVSLNGSMASGIPQIVNLSFKGAEGESIILSLDLKGVAVSSGSACTSGSLEASHVLSAMKVDDLLAQGSIRFSLGQFTTKADLEYTASILPDIIDRLRSMSAAYNG